MSRLDAKFQLKNPTAPKDTEVWFRVHCGNNEIFTYPLKSKALNKVLRIPTALWDSKKQEPYPVGKVPTKLVQYKASIGELSSMINTIKSAHPNILHTAIVSNIKVDKAYLKKSYDTIFGFAKVQKTILVSDYLDSFVKDIKSGVILTEKKTKYSDGSIKPYRTLINNLKMFDSLNSIETTFDTISSDWYDKFINFLYDDAECVDIKLSKDEYTPKSVGKYIKCLKHVMNYAYEKGLSTNAEFQKKYFKAPDKESFAVVLNVPEIKLLASLKLEGIDLECRDIFLVGCYSGLRQSDFSKIKPSHFSVEVDDKGTPVTVLSMITQKTTTAVSIPVVDDFLEIVKKYNYNLPSVSSILLNKRIKIIAEKAGITQEVSYTSFKGGEQKQVVVPKWKLIASHTCRRSAITNFYFYYKITAESIMRISGHKDYKTFKNYIRFGDKDNALEVAKQLTKTNNGNKPIT
jgi:integrase